MTFANNQRQARELCLQILFHSEYAPEGTLEDKIRNFRKSFSAPDAVWEYTLKVLGSLEYNKEKIDSLINANSSNWSLSRMALVDANILRIATCEIHFLHGDTPPKVAVNEAIEISKKYGTTDSSQFIAGVLGTIIRLSI
ncbi:MAG: transcription antitermination factor NusB [Bdellovibrionales bacterium]|nr:transcription antitermination factor NusB [Bdellovibrionales bacterium]